MSDEDKKRFDTLCREELPKGQTAGIGTYNEKSLHRLIKRFFCEDESRFEIKIGPHLADVLTDGEIIEVQTSSFYPLQKKIAYYLNNTGLRIRIVHPIISKKTVVRIDAESGEILRQRRSSAKRGAANVLPELYWLGDDVKNERLCIDVFLVSATEYRFSDVRYRYRKAGRYDSVTVADALEERYTLQEPHGLLPLLPADLLTCDCGFTAAEFAKKTGLRGGRAYSALAALCNAGVLKKEKPDGSRAAVYIFE